LVTAVRLIAAPPEPIRKPVKLLSLGEDVDRDFAKLTDIGITPSLTYYGVFQGNPVAGVRRRTADSHLILFGVELNFDSLAISGAQATGENLSSYIGNINTGVGSVRKARHGALSPTILETDVIRRQA